MINAFIIKKWTAFFMLGMLPTIFYAIGTLFGSMLWGVAFMFPGILIGMFFGTILIKNPFTDMLEGKGLLTVNLDSTGLLQFFLIKVFPPYIEGKHRGKNIQDIFDREAVFNIIPPKKGDGLAMQTSDGGIMIKLSNQEFNKGRFAALQYPVLIWNDQIKSIITKDFLSHRESTAFVKHLALFSNRKIEELTSVMRDFARHVVETTRPLAAFMQGKGKWIILVLLVGFIVLMLVLFGPSIWEIIVGNSGSATQIGKTTMDAINTVKPR